MRVHLGLLHMQGLLHMHLCWCYGCVYAYEKGSLSCPAIVTVRQQVTLENKNQPVHMILSFHLCVRALCRVCMHECVGCEKSHTA
jgi:hypothetical protein